MVAEVVVGQINLTAEEAGLVRVAVVVKVRREAVVDLVEEAAAQLTKPEVMGGLAVVAAAQLVLVED